MDPKTWAMLDRLLDEALDLPMARRAQWLDSLGADYGPVMPRLRALLALASSEAADDFLGTLPKLDSGAPCNLMTEAALQEDSAHEGMSVGPYRLMRLLGEGGMGTVWLAERSDGLLKRPVALKLPRGALRAGLSERIARERDILAELTHPNIARLYDAGSTAYGQPYLALELVEGVALNEYVQRERLDLPARLRVFLQIARAVVYAHANLVVHRDLKPSNILVTGDGQVKLLDFGIAKLLDDNRGGDTPLTELAGRPLTPEYASPEQLAGEPLTVAADVYSLGVVLYELLAGVRPHRPRRASRAALQEAILQDDAPRPSDAAVDPRVRVTLRGDLDTIVSKALKRQPQERYPTANAFAEDIERYLSGHPVVARPDSTWYRARKFVARNRYAVAAAGVVLIAVLGGAGVALWQMREATAQRDAALQNQRRAEAFSEFMKVLLQDAGSSGRPLTITELLNRGTLILDRQQALDESAAAYMRYEISRNYLMFNQTDRELSLLDRSAEGARRIGDTNLFAAAECSAAWSLMARDRTAAEVKLVAAERALAGAHNASLFSRADCLRARGRFLQASGDIPAAIAVVEEGLDTLDREAGQTWSSRDLLMTQLADFYRATDRFKDAIRLSERSLDTVRSSGRAGSMLELSAMNNHAANLNRLGELARGAILQRHVLEMVEQTDPSVQPVGIRSNFGFTLLRIGQPQRAYELAGAELLLAQRVGNATAQALSHFLASRSLLALGRIDDARKRLEMAEALWHSDSRMYARMLTEAALHRAEIQVAQKNLTAARRAVEMTLTALGYPLRKDAPGLDRALRLGAQINLDASEMSLAQRLATDALEVSRGIARNERESADVGLAALLRARALVAQGRTAQAADDVALAIDALQAGFGPDHADTAAAITLRAQLTSVTRGQ
jgi:eukaryotic-like serine/threonine-protein kinase